MSEFERTSVSTFPLPAIYAYRHIDFGNQILEDYRNGEEAVMGKQEVVGTVPQNVQDIEIEATTGLRIPDYSEMLEVIKAGIVTANELRKLNIPKPALTLERKSPIHWRLERMWPLIDVHTISYSGGNQYNGYHDTHKSYEISNRVGLLYSGALATYMSTKIGNVITERLATEDSLILPRSLAGSMPRQEADVIHIEQNVHNFAHNYFLALRRLAYSLGKRDAPEPLKVFKDTYEIRWQSSRD